MFEKYTLDGLNQEHVSISKQKYINHEGSVYPFGECWRCSYSNDNYGRRQIEMELPEAQFKAILSVWDES